MTFLFMASRYENEGLKAKKMQKIAKILKRKILTSSPTQDAFSAQRALTTKTSIGARRGRGVISANTGTCACAKHEYRHPH